MQTGFRPRPGHPFAAIAVSAEPKLPLFLHAKPQGRETLRTSPPPPSPTPAQRDRELDSQHETPAAQPVAFQKTLPVPAVAGPVPQAQSHSGSVPLPPAALLHARSLVRPSSECNNSSRPHVLLARATDASVPARTVLRVRSPSPKRSRHLHPLQLPSLQSERRSR